LPSFSAAATIAGVVSWAAALNAVAAIDAAMTLMR